MFSRILETAPATITTIDQKIADLFNNNFGLGDCGGWNWGNLLLCIIAIVLSIVLCGMIGLEREKRGRSAGLRTHLLVGVGSAIVMIISIYGFPAIFSNKEGAMTRDVARLAAGVITGVGFLGAGAIIHSNGGIKGLTTASTIWLVMAIGLACGSMNFILAIGSTVAVMIILVGFRKAERLVTRNNPQFIVLCPSDVPAMTELLSIAKEHKCSISDVTSSIVKDGNESRLEIVFKLAAEDGNPVPVEDVTKELGDRLKAVSVQILNHH